MTDRDALLRAILHDPTDDLPRLVFADWLDDHGEPERAKLIRQQIARTNGEQAHGRPGRISVRKWFDPWWTSYSSYSFHNPAWDLIVYPWRAWSDNDPASPEGSIYCRRGFVDEARLPLAAFLAHAPALFAAHPVTAVRLTDREPGVGYNELLLKDGRRIGDRVWRWWVRNGYDRPPYPRFWDDNNVLPAALFDRLVGHWNGDGHLIFESDKHALAALSAACVEYGRGLVGLPPLRTPAAA